MEPPRSLFQSLTRVQIPRIPFPPGLNHIEPSPNTRSQSYPTDSVEVSSWIGFSNMYRTITYSEYSAMLNIPMLPFPHPTPPREVDDEDGVKQRLNDNFMRRMNRALAASYAHQSLPENHTQLIIDGGGRAPIPRGMPDIAGHTNLPNRRDRVNRVPGDFKCSWKWKSTWRHSTVLSEQKEFKAVVAQLNYYMNLASSRYGYVITNAELVLFRKLDGCLSTDLEMAPGIPLNTFDGEGNFTRDRGELTAMLALWYIHMLAADDEKWWVEIEWVAAPEAKVQDDPRDLTYQP